MMKRSIILLILSLIIVPVKSQEKNELTEIIISSLKRYYNYHLNSEYRKSVFWQNNLGDTSLFLSVENYPFKLHKEIQNNSIQYVDFNSSVKYSFSKQEMQFQKSSIKKKIKKGLNVIFLRRLNLDADTLVVVFSKEIVTYKKHLSFAVGEWGVFKYIYSEEKGLWILIKEEFIGI